MDTIRSRKVPATVPYGHRDDGLGHAGTLLPKKRVVPSKDSLNEAHEEPKQPQSRRGQLIDILV